MWSCRVDFELTAAGYALSFYLMGIDFIVLLKKKLQEQRASNFQYCFKWPAGSLYNTVLFLTCPPGGGGIIVTQLLNHSVIVMAPHGE